MKVRLDGDNYSGVTAVEGDSAYEVVTTVLALIEQPRAEELEDFQRDELREYYSG